MAITFNKKERTKKKQLKKQQKQEKKEHNKLHNDKGKSFEEMFAYVDEHGNISDTPPTVAYKFKEEDLQRPQDNVDEYDYGKVSYYNDQGRYGFIRNNLSGNTVYFNDILVGFVLKIDQKVKYKTKRSKQGEQVTEVIIDF